MDIAQLGLAVRSDGVVVATDRLRKFRAESGQTEVAAKKLTGSLARMATVAGSALAAAFGVGKIIAYQDALAEVSTLVDTNTFSMTALSNAALDQGRTFGNVQGQVKAYYQIISAGAGSVAEATDNLTASNKLAVGGVTDIATAADGLTSVLNAYGDKVEGATAVSDALFTGMRAGKTTIGELSGALGKVAPLAAQTGVSFDELVASVAALTKGGISTNESITGVRAVLAAVAKPTSEATKLANKLGLEFNSAALASNGLAGFLDELVAKTGGNTDALAQLFGGVEALVPVMALSGQAGKDFTSIMEQMAVKAGATEEAFNKMAASPGFQANRLFGTITAEAIEMSGALSNLLVPVLTSLADKAVYLSDVIGRLVAIAGVMGAYMAGAWVASFVAANGVVGTLVIGLTTLRAAIIRTGIGLLVVAAGELVYQFVRLIEKTGSVSGALAEMGEIGNEVMWALGIAAESVADKMTAAFLNAFATIQDGFADTLSSFGLGSQADSLRALAQTNRNVADNRNTAADIGFGLAGDALTGAFSEASSALGDTPGALGSGGGITTLADPFDLLGESAKAANDNVTDLTEGLKEATAQGESFGDIIKDGVVGAFQGLGKIIRDGGDAWDYLRSKALNVLDSITNKALEMAGNGILNMIMGFFGGSGFGVGTGGGLGFGTARNTPLGFGSYGSFEGGGDTGPGARVGGIDGRGGFPAILHPNETVIDNMRAANNNTRPQTGQSTSIVRIELGEGLEGRIIQKSAGQTLQIVGAAAPAIAEQGANMAGDKLGRGELDSSMQRFGVSPVAKRR